MNWLLIGCSWHAYSKLYRLFKYVLLGHLHAWWRHCTTMTRILQGFTFFCKLGLLSFKPHWGYQIYIWKKNEKNSGRNYKMTPSCKRTFGTKNRKALECVILTILLFCFNNGDAGVLRCLARFSLVGFFSFFISIDYSRYVQRCVIQFKLTELMNQFGTGSVTFTPASACSGRFYQSEACGLHIDSLQSLVILMTESQSILLLLFLFFYFL